MMITRFFVKCTLFPLALLGLISVLLLAACSSNTGNSPASQTLTAHATLKHGPLGTAALSWDPKSHLLTVQLSMTGFAPKSKHPAHIHAGSCAQAGKVVYPLEDVVADAHGVANTTTTINNVLNGIPATGWYINVHNGPQLTAEIQALPIACGDIANPNASTTTMQSLQVTLADSPSPNQSASGTTALTLSAETLTVKITMSNLVPNSSHMAHIHAGSCTSQGKVVYGLQPVVADASGNGSSTTVLTGVKAIPGNGWYVNAHLTLDMSTQTGNDPIACGNVTLG